MAYKVITRAPTAKDMASIVAENLGDKTLAKQGVDATVAALQEMLTTQGCIHLPGFGRFALRKVRRHNGRNPQTGEKIYHPCLQAGLFHHVQGVEAQSESATRHNLTERSFIMAYKVVSAKPTITTLRSMVAGKLGDKKTAHQAVNATIEAFQSLLTGRGQIKLPGFGTFTMRDIAARTVRNPQTGQPLPLPAHKKAGYRMSKTWKSKVNNRA